MPSLSRAKSMGQVGSIFVLLLPVPDVGFVLGIVGLILVLLAIKEISEVVSDRAIFNNMLWSIILAIVGIVIAVLVVVASVLHFIGLGNLSGIGSSFKPSTVPSGDWMGLIGSIIAGLVVVWLVMIASAVFVRRSYSEIAAKLKVDNFNTAGLIYLIGAATTIFLVGFILLFVAQILVVVSFFSIEDKPS
jgi:uncharacterized membrane protein